MAWDLRGSYLGPYFRMAALGSRAQAAGPKLQTPVRLTTWLVTMLDALRREWVQATHANISRTSAPQHQAGKLLSHIQPYFKTVADVDGTEAAGSSVKAICSAQAEVGASTEDCTPRLGHQSTRHHQLPLRTCLAHSSVSYGRM